MLQNIATRPKPQPSVSSLLADWSFLTLTQSLYRADVNLIFHDSVTVGMAKVSDRAEREPELATDQRGQPFHPDCPEPRVCRLGNLCLGSCKLFPLWPNSA